MAAPPCMSGDGRPAVFVGTLLQTGQAVALCDECLVPWAAALLQGMTGVDATPFIAAIADDVDATPLTAEDEQTMRAQPPETPPDPPAAPPADGPTPPGSVDPGTGADPADDQGAGQGSEVAPDRE